MSPRHRALHTKNATAFFAPTRAAFAEFKLCFRRLKKDGENCGTLYGKKNKMPSKRQPPLIPSADG